MTNALRSKVSRSSLEKESLLEVQAERVEMTLNTESAVASGLLIQRLTELYEDPIEASVRETVSNGLDAVAESYSGETPEIHITSPSALNPVFTVRDNGVGMTYDDLKEIYSKYGASTKMDNFEQIGAYGLGAKAPLAYGTEFTVSSVKDGQRTTIIVAREELTNYIQIVDSVETDDPSGTTVSIPVSNYDIERFQSHIKKYQENPVDKDVKFIINHEEVVESDYVQITDDMPIFKSNGDVVTGRLWIKKDENTIVNLSSNMSGDDVRRSLQYLIGGWSYSSPSRRNSYYRNTNGLMVELKAGIVGFNSSRDAILENERYTDLENLVVEYVKSEEFMNKLISTVNSLNLDLFKSIVVSLLKRSEHRLSIKDGKINVEEITNHYSNAISREFSISDFTHNETGFRFDHMLKGVPTEEKQTAAILESKVSYRKTVYNSILLAYDNPGEEVKHKRFDSTNVADMLSKVEDIMYGTSKSHSLESLMLNLALSAYTGESKNMKITFITDIEADIDESEKTTDFSRLRSGRKTIIRMRNKGKDEGIYDSYVIYTEHDKASIEKMLKEAKFDDLDVSVETASDMVEKVNEYRKQNRTASRKTTQRLTTSLSKYDHELNDRKQVSVEDIEIEDDVTNLILVSKEGYVSNSDLKMILSWYCNENKLQPEEVQLYSSVGNHRVVDVEVLSELGELYENPRSRHAGNSKLYSETLNGRVAKMHSINENGGDVEKKSFVRMLSDLFTTMPSNAVSELVDRFESAYEVAMFVGVEMVDIPEDLLNELGKFGDDEFGQNYRGRDWMLENSAAEHLLKNIDKDKHDLIESLSALNSSRLVSINENGELERHYLGRSMYIDKAQVEESCKEKNKDSSFHKMIRLQAEAYLDFVNSIITKLSNIKF